MKIQNQSRKRSHKLDGIGVGRIRTFSFLPIPFTTPSLMIQWKLGCRSRKHKRKNQPIKRFILPFLLATPTMQFSLDRKRRRQKQNQCSASDSVGLVFTRSYRSTLLITTPTTTPSLVKTSLNRIVIESVFEFLDPGNKGENISYWHSDDSATVNNHSCDEDAPKQGRPRQLNPKEEYF